jgi:hypothetical protein
MIRPSCRAWWTIVPRAYPPTRAALRRCREPGTQRNRSSSSARSNATAPGPSSSVR